MYQRKKVISLGYGDFDHKKCATKKIIINKKLRKADKKWIKKFAEKWHVKVIEKL